MKYASAFAIAWRAIRGHKLRSTLTTVGVVIGVAAVITFVTLGASLSAAIVGEVGTEQATTMNVWAGPEAASGSGNPGFGAQPVFTQHDVEQLRQLEGVESVNPIGPVPTTAISYRNDSVAQSSILATSPSYLNETEFRAGRNFENGKREVVLNLAAAEMFEDNVTVGENVTINVRGSGAMEATVVGILNTSASQSALEGFGSQARIYAPTDPFYRSTVERPGTNRSVRVYSFLLITAQDPGAVDETQGRVLTYLQEESDAAELAPKEYVFQVQTNQELLAQLEQIINQLTNFVTGIAVLALLVGAIGIANIMLVSVTERTREIGIMKAVGARKSDVIKLFVIEASIIGVIGAAIGTALGVFAGWVATRPFLLDLPLTFPLEWFPIAIGIGVAVGILAGLYPAWRGAATDPIEALRYE